MINLTSFSQFNDRCVGGKRERNFQTKERGREKEKEEGKREQKEREREREQKSVSLSLYLKKPGFEQLSFSVSSLFTK